MAKITDPKHRGKVLDTNAILDDQSNTSFADLTVFDFFNVEPNLFGYFLSTFGKQNFQQWKENHWPQTSGSIRQGEVAFMADFESMFHPFQVAPEHRYYFHFFWFCDIALN